MTMSRGQSMSRDRLHSLAIFFAALAIVFAVLLISMTILGAESARAETPRTANFVDAAELVPGLVVEMRYAGSHNFVGQPINGYERGVCLLTRAAVRALAEVQRDLQARGLGLKVFDCYRPRRAVAQFIHWAQDIADVRAKAEFYPGVDKRELFRLGYIASQSGHSRGSTVDLTLVRRDGAVELDMGTGFDFFSKKSWPSDRSVSAEARENRMTLADAMKRHGFKSYNKEWWHFTLEAEPYPGRYFDFPVR
jgi:zinc D-Ala-D-Ala dipeptidase